MHRMPSLEETLEPVLPSGYSCRPIEDADAQEIVDLINVEAQAINGEPAVTLNEFLADHHEPGADPAVNTRVVRDDAGKVAALVEVSFLSPFVRTWVWAHVGHEHRGRGLGSALTRWGEARAASRVADAPADAEVGIESYCYANVEDAIQLLADFGYTQHRVFHAMFITMESPPPAAEPPQGIVLTSLAARPDTPLRTIHRTQRESFADHFGFVERDWDEAFADWEHDFLSKDYDPATKFLAFEGDKLVGVSLCIPPVPGQTEAGWVNQLGVLRPWRRRGLAQALLLHSFDYFYANGTRRVGLAVDADSLTNATRLYEKVGMHTETATLSWRKVLRPGVDLLRRKLDGE